MILKSAKTDIVQNLVIQQDASARHMHDLSPNPVAVMEKTREKATESWTRSKLLRLLCYFLQKRTYSSGCRCVHTTFSCKNGRTQGITVQRTGRPRRHQRKYPRDTTSENHRAGSSTFMKVENVTETSVLSSSISYHKRSGCNTIYRRYRRCPSEFCLGTRKLAVANRSLGT